MRSLFISSIAVFLFSISSFANSIKAVPQMKNVIWVWLENTSYADMNAQKYVKNIWLNVGAGRFSNFKPVSKVTQANVMAMVTGSDQGITDNESTRIFAPSILDLLESRNIPWKVYSEDYPGGCYLSPGSADYRRYRVPFLSLDKVLSDRYLCAKVQSYMNFTDDRMRGTLPQVTIIVPNMKSSGATSSAAVADSALKSLLDPIVTSPEIMAETTIFISTTNMVDDTKPAFAMIFGNGVNIRGTTSTAAINHYSILKTIEQGLDLGNLNGNDVTAEPILDIWK